MKKAVGCVAMFSTMSESEQVLLHLTDSAQPRLQGARVMSEQSTRAQTSGQDERFGRWTVLGPAETTGRLPRLLCRCDCGTVRSVARNNLRHGATLSCGCLSRETTAKVMTVLHRTHGMKYTPEYRVWTSLIHRCRRPQNRAYRNYGGRGIRVCDRWANSFEAFIEDVGCRPSPTHSIDRIDNEGHYEPGNVRWATREEQATNRRTNLYLELNGERKTLSQWSRVCGINRVVIKQRLDSGWTLERALHTPVKILRRRSREDQS